jgi:hypothetical protein
MGNDLARQLNAPYLFGGDEMDECSLGKYHYKTVGELDNNISLTCVKCNLSGEKDKLHSLSVFKGEPNESVLLFHFAPNDETTTYGQKIGGSVDQDGAKLSGELSKSVTIKKGSPLVKMIMAKTDKNIMEAKSFNDLYKCYCVDCILSEQSQKSRIKSILLHVNGNGYIINSDYKIISPSYGDSK